MKVLCRQQWGQLPEGPGSRHRPVNSLLGNKPLGELRLKGVNEATGGEKSP